MQAFKLSSPHTIAIPGGKLKRVIKAPIEVFPPSKRADLIENAESKLDDEMDGLQKDTRRHHQLMQSYFVSPFSAECVILKSRIGRYFCPESGMGGQTDRRGV
jgi:hypothetical protein